MKKIILSIGAALLLAANACNTQREARSTQNTTTETKTYELKDENYPLQREILSRPPEGPVPTMPKREMHQQHKAMKATGAVHRADYDTYGIAAEEAYYVTPYNTGIQPEPGPGIKHNTESYNYIAENVFMAAGDNPLSTFSIDVDAASYTNTRRYLNNGSLPPKDAVRIEEFINYFTYDYPQPSGEHPFSITTEVGICPWNNKHQLIHIGLQGKNYSFEELNPMNLVFLVDVSGSMESDNKLPLFIKSMKLLVSKLRPQDRVSIVVYAGAAGLVLPSTTGDKKTEINRAFDALRAGGSTAGGQGLILAYKIAKENFIAGGINRVILASDGDFNVGPSSDAEMTRLIEERRDQGVFLTVLGFGMGNYKDSKMESIADKGNGNYFYIDNIQEADKVLYSQLDGTLCAIAKDVKLQVEFNPNKVKAYRLIGYENRMLAKEDFNDDKKDAGELGAGHTVTALYEIIPAGSDEAVRGVDELKYQKNTSAKGNFGDELLTIKFRYKKPDEEKSKLLSVILKDKISHKPSDNFVFSAAVAGFGMLLRQSEHKGNLTYQSAADMAYAGKGKDAEGYRSELVKLIKTAGLLAGTDSHSN